MTGRRVALRAGAAAALAAALLTGLPVPAQAQPGSELRLGGIGNIELRVGGGEQNVQLRVENRGDLPALNVQLTMTVPMGDLEVHIASTPPECNLANDSRMDCRIDDIQPDQTWSGVAQIGVHGNSPLQAGETRNGTAEVVLSGGGSQSFNVRLQGPDRPEGVPEVSGFVTDQATGEPIEGARVLLVDSQNAELSRTTNADGQFSFSGDQIAPGSIGLQASKDGYEGQQVIEQGQAGDALSGVQLVLVNTATPTPSASPTPSPTASPTGTPVPAPAADTGDSGGSFFTTLLVILGIVFVLLGVAAIVVLIIRRRRERGEEDGLGDDDPTSGPRGPGPRPGSHGVYRPSPTAAQTQVIGGRGGAVPGVGPSPALANAPTMMHQRGGAADATMLQPRVGGADETAMMPRAGDPPGPRPPMAGGPPPPRPAAPTYGGGAATTAYQPTAGYDDPRGGRHAGGGPYATPEYGGAGEGGNYGSPPHGSPGYSGPADQTEVGGYGAAPPPTGRHGHSGGGYGSAVPDGGSYGPDPYTQPSAYPPPAGYGQPGHRDQGYPDSGYRTEEYGGRAPTSGHRADPYRGPTDAGHSQPAGYDQPAYGAGQPPYGGQPGHDQPPYGGQPTHDQPAYGGQPGHGGQPGYPAPPPAPYPAPGTDPAGYDRDAYDQAGRPRPRSRHAAEPTEQRRLDWLDDT